MFVYPRNKLSPAAVLHQKPKFKVAPLETKEVPKTPVSYGVYNPSFCWFLLWYSKIKHLINRRGIN